MINDDNYIICFVSARSSSDKCLNSTIEEMKSETFSHDERTEVDSLCKILENLPPRKSKVSRGYRYCYGRLMRTDPSLGPVEV
ncbi:hypothetical protein Ciccas_012982, partial [Cichlidogyrus casuarinus]